MNNKITIIGIHNFNSHTKELFFVDDFKDKQIEYLNLSLLYNEKVVLCNDSAIDEIVIKNYEELKNYLKVTQSIVLISFQPSYERIKLIKILEETREKYFCIDNMVTDNYTRKVKLKDIIRIKKIIKKIILKIELMNGLFKKVIIFSNEIKKNKKNYLINSLEYERLLKIKHETLKTKEKYIVFLDQYFPYHLDNRLFEKKFDAEGYYKELTNFFKKVEKETGYKIVISLHPKSEKIGLYKEFDEVIGQTPLLCKNAQAILTHYSLGRNFGLILNKSTILIKTSHFDKIDSCFKNYMKFLSKKYGFLLMKTNDKIKRECFIDGKSNLKGHTLIHHPNKSSFSYIKKIITEEMAKK